MKYKGSILLFTLLFLTLIKTQTIAQITRGAQPGELYLTTDWYMDNYGHIHYGIFRSVDNGATITLQYESSTASPPSEMGVGKVLGDATPGALYNYGGGELWVSFDLGESWQYVENYTSTGFYTSGSVEGEIYKNGTDVEGTLFYSDSYGSSFNINNLDIKFYLEVGTEPGELYGKSGFAGIGFNLKYSFDYGQNFITIPIDSVVAFWSVSGNQPRISRGTQAGEMYLISWWLDSNYKIFHSTDTGYSWTQKYESEYIDLYFWRVFYTAGREPGSFYVMRSRINDAGDHVWLYIDYSSDYGETFTTYFHDLDSTITDVNTPEIDDNKLSNYPNPFINQTTFTFKLPKNCTKPVLSIYNVRGDLIRQYNVSGKSSLQWDGTDSYGNTVCTGIYFYKIRCKEFSSEINKLLIIR
ncbi:MAG: FlgD immunoglobulin-like domain containing protein [Bacteroidales bacterium]